MPFWNLQGWLCWYIRIFICCIRSWKHLPSQKQILGLVTITLGDKRHLTVTCVLYKQRNVLKKKLKKKIYLKVHRWGTHVNLPSLLCTLLITRARSHRRHWVCNELCLVKGGVFTWTLEGKQCVIATSQLGWITFNLWQRIRAFSHQRSLSLVRNKTIRAFKVFFCFKFHWMFAFVIIILLKNIWKYRKEKRKTCRFPY